MLCILNCLYKLNCTTAEEAKHFSIILYNENPSDINIFGRFHMFTNTKSPLYNVLTLVFNSHAEVLIFSCKNIAVTTEIKVAKGRSQKRYRMRRF